MSTSDGSTAEYTGRDVSYYLVRIESPKRLEPYYAECEDIIEALGMTFAEGCAFKAIWRKCAARTLGIAKAGYKGGLYDAEKAEYYGARMVAAELRAATVKESLTVHHVHPATFDHIDPADVEIASAIDDDSERMQAIGQNGEMASEVYAAVDSDDQWKGAPRWAKYKAQDKGGEWCWFEQMPVALSDYWENYEEGGKFERVCSGEENDLWAASLICR